MTSKQQSCRKKVVRYVFGSSLPRFTAVGLHPALDTIGCYKKPTSKGGPGAYHIKNIQCIRRGTNEPVWTRMKELEEFSKYLGFRNAPILEARHFQKVHRGPGTYNIPDDIDRHKSCSILKNKDFSTGERFKSYIKRDQPPPDTYFRNIFHHPHKSKKSFGKVQRFEWDGLACRFKNTEPSFRKPPNLYNVPDPTSMEALLKKVVSKKGPYNLFSGTREDSSIKNHFAPPTNDGPDRYHLEPSPLDRMLHHPQKKKYGRFLQEERFPKKFTQRMLISDPVMCYKDPDAPGPGFYETDDSVIVPRLQVYPPFNSSNLHQRPPIPWPIQPGPGRYSPKPIICKEKKRPSWVFASKVGRNWFTPVGTEDEF